MLTPPVVDGGQHKKHEKYNNVIVEAKVLGLATPRCRGESVLWLPAKVVLKIGTVEVPLVRDHLQGHVKVVFQKRWSLTRGGVIWGMYTFVTSKGSLAKGVVFHEGCPSKGVLLYMNG